MSTIHCFFCGGKDCKYENYKLWITEKAVTRNAIDGLYSSWITPNILAMQRPSTRLLKEYDLINVFKANSIGAVFNLQLPGEHAACGDGIEPSSQFSYLPESLMDAGIYYFNFGWQDMETPDLQNVLDIVQVMSYSISKAAKVAVHCHAGLGRTGLVIACYLIYSENISAESAILLVRSKRPGSVQTAKQVAFVHAFELFLKQLVKVFPEIQTRGQPNITFSDTMTFDEIVHNQLRYLHGIEQRALNGVPKIVFKINSRLFTLLSNSDSTQEVFETFISFEGFDSLPPNLSCIMYDLNQGVWGALESESNVQTLIQLLCYWLISLKKPLLSNVDLLMINDDSVQPPAKILNLEKKLFETLNYMIHIFRTVSFKADQLDLIFAKLSILITARRSSLKYKFQHFDLMEKLSNSQQLIKKSASESLANISSTLQSSYLKSTQFAQKLNNTYFLKRPGDVNKVQNAPDKHSESLDVIQSPSDNNTLEADNITLDNVNHADLTECNTNKNDKHSVSVEDVKTAAEPQISIMEASTKDTESSNDLRASNLKNDLDVETGKISLDKLQIFLKYILTSYTCQSNTRAIFKETMTPINPATETLHASAAVENMGFGSLQNLAESLQTLHSPIKPTLMDSVSNQVSNLRTSFSNTVDQIDIDSFASQIKSVSIQAFSSLSGTSKKTGNSIDMK